MMMIIKIDNIINFIGTIIIISICSPSGSKLYHHHLVALRLFQGSRLQRLPPRNA